MANLLRTDELLAAIADLPRWVEPRSALLDAKATGVAAFGTLAGFALVVPDGVLGAAVFVGGTPLRDDVRDALASAPGAEIVAAPEALAALGVAAAAPSRIVVFRIPEGHTVPAVHPTVVLERDDVSRFAHVHDELRRELEAALVYTPIVAALDGDALGAFCYPGATTETHWDVSIDTLEPYRRRGLAASAFAKTAERMAADGRRPVWQAEESNVASMRLAAKLGFEPVDELFFVKPHDLGL